MIDWVMPVIGIALLCSFVVISLLALYDLWEEGRR